MGYCISKASQRVLADAVCVRDEGEGSPGVVVGGGLGVKTQHTLSACGFVLLYGSHGFQLARLKPHRDCFH
jgi:hypothetical protein